MTIDPEYETPTLTEIVDIIDLLRPWEHGFTWVGDPLDGVAICDCGWISAPHTYDVPGGALNGIEAYQRHVGYESE